MDSAHPTRRHIGMIGDRGESVASLVTLAAANTAVVPGHEGSQREPVAERGKSRDLAIARHDSVWGPRSDEPDAIIERLDDLPALRPVRNNAERSDTSHPPTVEEREHRRHGSVESRPLAQATRRIRANRRRGMPTRTPSNGIANPAGGGSTVSLPAPLTPFVGRDDEIFALHDMLRRPEVRLLTLTGPGGVGKTRLALRVAEAMAGDFPDGLFYVPLGAVHEADIVPSVISRALGVREVGHRSLLDGIVAFCGDQEILLLLDNFEHVAEAATFVAELLARCPGLTCLITSRALLRITGEHAFPVSPLPLPSASGLLSVEQAAVSPAVRLFVARAQAVQPSFELSQRNAAAVETICRRLDGLPLAIELAAARIRHLTPTELASRLVVREGGAVLQELAGGPLDAPARQQTLRYAIAWSYELLCPAERALFRRLAIFVGGFTTEAAEAVGNASGDAVIDVAAVMATLVDQSLLRQEEALGGGSRYGMLETVREFALEQLVASSEDEAVIAAHASYFLALAELAAPQLSTEHQQEWLDRLHAELPNVRAVLARWEHRHDVERALRLAAALWRFWHRRGYWEEGRGWLVRMLQLTEDGDPVDVGILATAHTGAGWLAHYQGDFAAAGHALGMGLEGYRRLGRKEGQVDALHGQALVAQSLGENARAATLGEEALALARLTGDHTRIAESLGYLSRATRELGDYVRAAALAQEALVLQRAARNRGGAAVALLVLGDVARDLGEAADVRVRCDESLAMFRELGEPLGEGFALHNLAVAAYSDGDLALARQRCQESLDIFRRLDVGNAVTEVLASLGRLLISDGDVEAARTALIEALHLGLRVGPKWVAAAALEGIASIAAGEGEHRSAVELASGAAALRDEIKVPVRPNWRRDLERTLAASQKSLGHETYAAVWASAQDQPLALLVAAAEDVRGDSSGACSAIAGQDDASRPFGLSPREIEVMRLLVAGKTDREIADELFISPRTASKHVGAILLKLDVGSRGEAAVHAIRHGLV